MGRWLSRKALRRTGRLAAWTAAGLLGLLAAALACAQTPWAKRALADAAAGWCARELGWRVELATPEGVLPLSLRLPWLRLADSEGVWLDVENASLRVAPWPFGTGLCSLRLHVVEATLPRAPAPSGEPAPPSHPLAFLDSLSPLPLSARLQAQVDSLRLGPALAGQAVQARIDAQALARHGALTARLDLTARGQGAGPEGGAARPGDGDEPGARNANTFPTDSDADVPTRLVCEAGLDPGARTAGLRLTLAEGPDGLAASLAGLASDAPLSLSLEGEGPLSDWQAALAARQGPEETLSGRLRARLGRSSTDDADVALTLTIRPLLLPLTPQVRRLLGDRIDLSFSGTLLSAGLPEPQWRVQVKELRLTAETATATLRGDSGPLGLAPRLSFGFGAPDAQALGVGSGPLAVTGELQADIDPAGPVTAQLQLSSPDLATALAPLNVGLSGKASVAAQLTGDLGADTFAVTLDAGLSELAATTGAGAHDLGPKLAAALGREVTLHARGDLSGGGRVTLSQLRLGSRAVRAEASGGYAVATRQASLRASLDAPDLAALAPLAGMRLAGALTLRAEAEGALDALQVLLDVEAKGLGLDRTRFDRAKVSLHAAPKGDGGEGALEVRAEKGPARLGLSTAFTLAGQRLSLRNVQAAGPGLAASGALEAALDQGTASGQLKAAADLAPLGAFLGRKMAGRAQTELALAASGPRQDVTARVEASALAAEGLSLKKADLSASFTDVLRAPQGELRATLRGLTAGAATVEQVEAKAQGLGRSVDFSLALKGTRPEAFEAAAAGSFTPAPGGGALRLAKLDAAARGMRLALSQPATAAFAPGTMSLDGLHLSLDGAAITASGALKPGSAAFSADVTALPLALMEKAGLPALRGSASASLRASGAPGAPQVTARLALDQLATPGAQGASANATLEAHYAAGRLTASLRASAGAGADLVANASLPARLSLSPFAFALARDAALEAGLQGEVDLARLAALSGDEALSLLGTLKADLSASGRVFAPTVTGRVALAGGQADYVATGTRLRDITLDLEATGTRLTLKTFSARDAGQGRLVVTGQADLSPGSGFPFEAQLAVDKLTPVRMDMVTAALSAQVGCTGDARGARVAGQAHVGPVEVNIPDRLPPDATPIAVEMPGAPGQAAARPAPASGSYPVALDVAVDFPGRVFVRGLGLDSQWAGGLRIQGSPSQPEIGGAVRIVKGQLDFFGKSFSLTRGEVTFSGAAPPIPLLDMEAKTQTNGLTASILVSGDAKRPSIEFSSDPVVPRDEILSRVLFGQSVSSLTPPQALQMAQAVAAMSGAGGSLDFLGATRRLTGLDYLGVKSSGQSLGQSSVAAGKYVADGVYVEASQGLTGTSGAVSVEVDLTKNITIESKVGLDAKTGVGVNWKFDY